MGSFGGFQNLKFYSLISQSVFLSGEYKWQVETLWNLKLLKGFLFYAEDCTTHTLYDVESRNKWSLISWFKRKTVIIEAIKLSELVIKFRQQKNCRIACDRSATSLGIFLDGNMMCTLLGLLLKWE